MWGRGQGKRPVRYGSHAAPAGLRAWLQGCPCGAPTVPSCGGGAPASVAPIVSPRLTVPVYPPPPLQYYDVPSLSVRSAVFPLMQAGVPGFRPDKIWLLGGKGSKVSASGAEIPKAPPEERPLFFYADR